MAGGWGSRLKGFPRLRGFPHLHELTPMEDLIKQEAGPLDPVCLLESTHLAKLSIHFLFQQL